MASLSTRASSASIPPRKWEVFLRFTGFGTRVSFEDHLYRALTEKGIKVIAGGHWPYQPVPEEAEAIQQSQYAVIIITREYPSFNWSLEELTKIMKRRREIDLTVLPIFYHVDRSDVRNQRGNFAEAFRRHNDPGVDIQKTNTWRAALTEISDINGWRVADRYESEAEVVKTIRQMISDGLRQSNQ